MIFFKTYHFFFLLVICTAFKCVQKISSTVEFPQKINGLSIASGPQYFDSLDVVQWKNSSADWICFMPFAFVNTESGKLVFDHTQQWQGETYEGIKRAIVLAKASKLNVFIKPQLWFGYDKYTGDIDFSEGSSQWINFKQDYAKFIKRFHSLADSLECNLFSIGTELNLLIKHHEGYWENLISELKSTHVKLTYAENWDVFENCTLWEKLDFVGVNAYFPVSKEKNCSLNELHASWSSILLSLEKVSAQSGKPILFTEYGYRSIDYCGKEPWNYSKEFTSNEQNQFNCLSALFDNCWNKAWFAGGFLWKEYGHHHPEETPYSTDFTVYQKKSFQLLKSIYQKK